MQKSNTQLHNSTDKDKNKGKTEPFLDPKRAKKVLKEDKKLLEELKKLAAPIIVGLFLTCLWLYRPLVPRPSAISINDNNIQNSPPNAGQELAPGIHPVPAPESSVNSRRSKKPADPVNHPILSTKDNHGLETKEKEVEKINFIAFLPTSGELKQPKSPVHLLSSMVIDKCRSALNSEIFDVDELKGTDIGHRFLLEYIQQKNPNLNQLTLIKFELLELCESSGKELYTLSPENKARIQLIIRGIDAQSGTILFEKTLEKEIIRSDWAKYKRDTANSLEDNQAEYTISPAMEILLSETANDIISLLHKCLP